MSGPGRHVPPDEHVPDEHCGNPERHDDHYWRADGKRCRYLSDPTVRYCLGAPEGPEKP